MHSRERSGTRRGAALVAVLQVILLLSALVLTPAATIAQDTDPAASHPPAAEPATEPAPEQGQLGSSADKRPAREAAQPTSEPKAAPAKAEVDLHLRLYPKKQKLFPGGKKVVSAWACPADVRASFGADKEPGTRDDDCEPARVKWSVQPDDGARLSNIVGFKTRLTLLSDTDLQIVAKVDGLIGKGTILAKDEPAKVRPQAATVEPTLTVKAEEPTAEPQAEEPTAEPQAEEPTAEPQAEEPTAEPQAEEPTAEPQAEEPTAEPSTNGFHPAHGRAPGGRAHGRAPGRRAHGRLRCRGPERRVRSHHPRGSGAPRRRGDRGPQGC